MQPHISQAESTPGPFEESIQEIDLPSDEGTLEADHWPVPPSVALEEQVVSPRTIGLFVAATVGGLLLAGALLLPVQGGFGQASQAPWVVLQMQQEALNAPIDQERFDVAQAAGQAYLDANPKTVWRTIIADNQAKIDASATSR